MKEFVEFLKRREFRIPVCVSCGSKAWPPSPTCPRCLSRTAMKEGKRTGRLLELSCSHVKGREGLFGVIQIDDIRLVGSFDRHSLREGMNVMMIDCGIHEDGTVFYRFAPT
ncbi:MAG: zinc ribbon domain-containing protein [Nitrososphaera sp.]